METPGLPLLILQRNTKKHIIYLKPSLNFNNIIAEFPEELQAVCNYLMPQNLKHVIKKTYKELIISLHCFHHSPKTKSELIAVSWERFQGWDPCCSPLGQHNAQPLPHQLVNQSIMFVQHRAPSA